MSAKTSELTRVGIVENYADGHPSVPPLRGRVSELDRAESLLEETAATGQASSILISGTPGIGKSAVLDRIVRSAKRRGFAIGRNKADEADQIAPMALLLLALRYGTHPLVSHQAFSDLASLRDQPLWLIDQLIAILEKRSMRTPILIALDDIQWADRLTLSCLRMMPARLAGSPIVWALSVRAEDRSLADVRETLTRDLVRVEELPLDRSTNERSRKSRTFTSAARRMLPCTICSSAPVAIRFLPWNCCAESSRLRMRKTTRFRSDSRERSAAR